MMLNLKELVNRAKEAQPKMTDIVNQDDGVKMEVALPAIDILGNKVLMSQDVWAIVQAENKGWLSYLAQQPKLSPFKFGTQSGLNLLKVYPPLTAVVSFALQCSAQDFGVTCGLRSQEDQSKAVDAGMSRTMHSLHLVQADGWAHAVDLVPWTGAYAWDWNRIYNVAAAMHLGATISGVADRIRWGGAWDRRLSDFGPAPQDFANGVTAYAARHQGSDLLDGPHFEWVV